jgi:hypothetical protein
MNFWNLCLSAIYGEVFLRKSREESDGTGLLNIGHQSGAGLEQICTMRPSLIAGIGV